MGVDLHSRPLASRELRATLVISGVVMAVAIGLPLLVTPTHLASPAVTLLYVAILAVVLRSSIQLGSSMAEPAELAFIPCLVVLPAPLIPLYVILAYALATALGVIVHGASVTRLAKAPMWAAFSIGPAIVLSVAGSASLLHSPALIAVRWLRSSWAIRSVLAPTSSRSGGFGCASSSKKRGLPTNGSGAPSRRGVSRLNVQSVPCDSSSSRRC